MNFDADAVDADVKLDQAFYFKDNDKSRFYVKNTDPVDEDSDKEKIYYRKVCRKSCQLKDIVIKYSSANTEYYITAKIDHHNIDIYNISTGKKISTYGKDICVEIIYKNKKSAKDKSVICISPIDIGFEDEDTYRPVLFGVYIDKQEFDNILKFLQSFPNNASYISFNFYYSVFGYNSFRYSFSPIIDKADYDLDVLVIDDPDDFKHIELDTFSLHLSMPLVAEGNHSNNLQTPQEDEDCEYKDTMLSYIQHHSKLFGDMRYVLLYSKNVLKDIRTVLFFLLVFALIGFFF